MSIWLGRPVGGGDKNEILLDDVLFWKGQWLRKVLQGRILMAPLVRISSLFKGGIVMTNLEAILVS
jgi:hypothetical protein